MPLTSRAIALVVSLAVLTACGSDAGSGGGDAALAEARAETAAAIDEVRTLARRVDELESKRLAEERSRQRMAAGLKTRIGDLARRLGDALASVREATDSAAASADSAVAQIGSITRDLSVLEERFDYHLRNSNGGG
ncbi:MAG: hypothetical protein M3516_06700 [Actinomycetota bacterium]|nr:hypothetical protein [Actinomycetota bacterium]